MSDSYKPEDKCMDLAICSCVQDKKILASISLECPYKEAFLPSHFFVRHSEGLELDGHTIC
jgi:hypothetical protein